ncbi:MAG: GGDEF domain-containing protein [Phycisphaerales bacterium]|nr:GGDEF domain-containing protein [Phycisphaerales bacterium]
MPELQVVEDILAGHRLPTLPAVAAEVLDMTSGSEIDVLRIADTVQLDQALAAKVLRTVNSSYYGLSRPCGTVQQAMVFLGLNTVKTLVLSFSLVDTIDGQGRDRLGFDYGDYWRRSIHTAVAARELARALGTWDPEEAFFAGLMQDFGMIAMYHRFGRQYVEAIEAVRGDHHELCRLERDLFQVTHPEIGASVAEQWKLPMAQVAAIRWHHDSQSADECWQAPARLIDLAGAMAASLVMTPHHRALNAYRRLARTWFDIDARDAEKILTATAEAAKSVSSFFRVDTGSTPDVERLMARAETQLFQHQIDMGRHARDLQQRNIDLTEKINRDGLTGLLDRSGFDNQLTRMFSETAESGRCLSLLFCDADRFKPINDRYGHAVGDAVLKHFAGIMQDRARREDIVCRFGGDEFVLLLPGCGEDDARRVAEDILTVLASTPLRVESSDSPHEPTGDMTLTSSMGLATFDPDETNPIESPEMLVTCADQAMYVAKRRGGNGVATWRAAA